MGETCQASATRYGWGCLVKTLGIVLGVFLQSGTVHQANYKTVILR